MPKKNLRQEAKGRECQIRTYKCNRNPETTVLCHVHKPSIGGGMGLKANDMLAAHGCSACHDYVDGRDNATMASKPERDTYLMEGVLRTLKLLLGEGKIGVI